MIMEQPNSKIKIALEMIISTTGCAASVIIASRIAGRVGCHARKGPINQLETVSYPVADPRCDMPEWMVYETARLLRADTQIPCFGADHV